MAPSATVDGDDVASRMELLPKSLTRPVARLGAAAQNALEVARFGGLATDEQPSPYEVAAEHRVYRLRRYFPTPHDRAERGPPVLLVPPMMLAAEVYDVSPATSAVTLLHEHGADPWVVDFGAPEHEPGGLERTLTDHVLAVSDAVERVREVTGRDVHLAGYSQGGMFCYQAAAYRRNAGLASLITFGSPVDTRPGMPFGIPEQFAAARRAARRPVLRGFGAARPGRAARASGCSTRSSRCAARSTSSCSSTTARRCSRARASAASWRPTAGSPGPGPALADFLRQFVAHNRMLEGGFVIEDRLVTLADIECPILSVVGTVDEIAPAAGVRAIRQAAPARRCLRARAAGRPLRARRRLDREPDDLADGRRVGALARRRRRAARGSERGPDDADCRSSAPRGQQPGRLRPRARRRSRHRDRAVARRHGAAHRTELRELTREAAGQLPRLARLEQIQPSTRISIGLLVEERLARPPTTSSSCSRTAPTRRARSTSGSTTSSAA